MQQKHLNTKVQPKKYNTEILHKKIQNICNTDNITQKFHTRKIKHENKTQK